MVKPHYIAISAVLVFGAVLSSVGLDRGASYAAKPNDAETSNYGGGGDWGKDQTSSNKRMVGSSRSASAGSSQTLAREPDGHFYATATIAARDLRLMVDTGASIVALTGNDARAMGLAWDEADVMPVGRGASGTVMGTPVMLDRVTIGDIEASDVQAVIIPTGLDVSLLGQSFLQKVGGMRVEGDRMTLGN